MTTRWLAPLALLVPAAVALATTGEFALIGLLAAPIAAAAIGRARIPLGTPAQVLAALACGLVAFVLDLLWPPGRGMATEALRPLYAQLAYGSLALIGIRLHLREPALGSAGTFALGLLVFLACGTVDVGRSFALLLVGYAALAFQALRGEDIRRGGRPSSLGGDPRLWAAGLLVLALSGVLTTALAAAVPRLQARVYDWALGFVDERRRAGFHDGPLALGSLGELLDSDEIVMRVEGDAGERLRGNVYTHYSGGRWLPPPSRDERSISLAPADPDAEVGADVKAVVRFARAESDRFFLPTIAGGVQASPSGVDVDTFGVLRTRRDEPPARLVLLASGGRPFASPDPEAIELHVPVAVREAVEEFVARTTSALAEPAQRITDLRAELERGYAYSLDGPDEDDETGVDPLLGFLTDRREGHCEYFASAMTLLARGAGVPARLVTGYRIAEHSRLGDYAIVRERHAHAWTEVFLEGRGWVDVDPSPLRGTGPFEAEWTPWWPALIDRGVVEWQRRGPESLLAALVVGLAVVQLWRIRRDRGNRRPEPAGVVESPPDWLTDLLDGLDRRGLGRAHSEPLESLARRVRAGSAADARDASGFGEAALLLRRYAALRYGGEGSAEQLREDFVQWNRRFRESTRRAGGANPPGAAPTAASL